MRQRSFTAAVCLLALMITACGTPEEEETVVQPIPAPEGSPTAAPQATDSSPSPSPSPSPVAEESPPSRSTTANLKPATDPDARAARIQTTGEGQATRQDPFAVLPIQPVPVEQAPAGTVGGTTAGGIPQLPTQEGRQVPSLPDLPGQIGPEALSPQIIAQVNQGTGGNGRGGNGRGGTGNQGTGGNGRGGTGNQGTGGNGRGGTGNQGTGGNGRGGTGNQGTGGNGRGGPSLPEQEGRTVGSLPELPLAIGPENLPPGAKTRGGEAGPPPLPPLGDKGVPFVPELPVAIGPEVLPPRAIARGGEAGPPPLPPLGDKGVPFVPELPVAIGPNVLPPPPAPEVAPPPPPPPSTDIAKAVEVTGVVQLGDQFQIIVRAPNEPTSRYVRVGQRIANGEVLIKRVDVQQNDDPIVILEQNGVEVSKIVGEKPLVPQTSPQGSVVSQR